jgi:hypothetical protein
VRPDALSSLNPLDLGEILEYRFLGERKYENGIRRAEIEAWPMEADSESLVMRVSEGCVGA